MLLLKKYNPLNIECQIQIPNAKQKAKDAATNLGRITWCNSLVKCYNLRVLNGGAPGSTFVYFINSNNPSSIAVCYIDAGRP
jgi:hypothetical protein